MWSVIVLGFAVSLFLDAVFLSSRNLLSLHSRLFIITSLSDALQGGGGSFLFVKTRFRAARSFSVSGPVMSPGT